MIGGLCGFVMGLSAAGGICGFGGSGGCACYWLHPLPLAGEGLGERVRPENQVGTIDCGYPVQRALRRMMCPHAAQCPLVIAPYVLTNLERVPMLGKILRGANR